MGAVIYWALTVYHALSFLCEWFLLIFKIGMNSISHFTDEKTKVHSKQAAKPWKKPRQCLQSPDSILSIYYWLLTIIGGHFWTPETMWCVMSFANIVSLQSLWDTNYAQVWLLRKWGSESEVCCLKKGLEPAHGPSSCQHQHASSRYLYCIMPLSWKGQCHVGEVSGELDPGRPSSISSLKSGSCYFFVPFVVFSYLQQREPKNDAIKNNL